MLQAGVARRLSCDPSREPPEARAALGRNRGTNPGRPGSQGKGTSVQQSGMEEREGEGHLLPLSCIFETSGPEG